MYSNRNVQDHEQSVVVKDIDVSLVLSKNKNKFVQLATFKQIIVI